MDTEESCNDKVKICAREARRSHEKTESALSSAQKTLQETQETTPKNEKSMVRSFNDILIELRSVIDRHMEKPEISQSKKKKGNKPVIRSVERVEMELPRNMKKKEVTWAQVAKTRTRNTNKGGNMQDRQKPIIMENI